MNDFTTWLHEAIQSGELHIIVPGRQVRFQPIAYPVVLSAEQAVEMANWLLECAAQDQLEKRSQKFREALLRIAARDHSKADILAHVADALEVPLIHLKEVLHV